MIALIVAWLTIFLYTARQYHILEFIGAWIKENYFTIFFDFMWLIDPTHHFLLASLVGVLAFLLTWITLRVLLLAWERGTHRKASLVVVCTILISCTSLAFGYGSATHYSLDFSYTGLTEPIDPPLKLNTPVP